MRRKHSPAEYYIKFLFSDPGRPSVRETEEKLEALDLELPTDKKDYLEGLRKQMLRRPRVYRPRTDAHLKTDRWLTEHKIRDMWRKTPGAVQAVRVLDDIRTREHVEALILSPLSYNNFAADLPEWMTEAGFVTYRHYFFNVSLLRDSEVLQLVTIQGGIRQTAHHLDPEATMGRAVLNYARGTDTLDVPMSIISKRVIDIATYKLSQISRSGASVTDSLMLKRYSDVLETAQRLMLASGVAAEDLIAVFMNFSISHDDEPEHVASYQEITGHQFLEEGGQHLLTGGENGRPGQPGEREELGADASVGAGESNLP